MAKRCFLDWLGSVHAGSTAQPTVILRSLVEELGGRPEAKVVGSLKRNTCLHAALVNGASSHVVEMDDLHKASIFHPAAPVIPAALAVAEREGKDGKEFLRAVVLGYEASIRIGEAVNPSHYRYWHTTGTAGTFGAAVAAGVLLGLSEEEMVSSLGSAGTQAAGLWEFLVDGAMSKQLHPGKAAMNGIFSSLLAKQGFTGAKRILEGEKGFCAAFSETADLSKITSRLGENYRIDGVSFKPHASCRHTHSAIDATLDMVQKFDLTDVEVESINVRVYQGAMDLLSGVEASTAYAAKFSMPFCIASAVLFREVSLAQFTEEALYDGRVRRIMEKVKMEADPSLDKDYPRKWPAVVRIATKGGMKLVANVEYPKGDPENPLTRDELCDKFRGMSSAFLPPSEAEAVIERIWKSDRLASVAGFLA